MYSYFTVFVLFFLSLFTVSNSEVCYGEYCEFKSPDFTQRSLTTVEIAIEIERQLRRSYWYYLSQSRVIYSARLDLPEKQYFLFFHQSVIGRFFTIAEYLKDTRVSKINTMVKVGPGSTRENLRTAQQIDFNNIDFTATIGEFIQLQQAPQQIDINVDIGDLSIQNDQDDNQCQEREINHLKQKYWYFLRGADVLTRQTISHPLREYHLYTMMNIVGTFLAITNCQGEQIRVYTLVRLGMGGKPELNS